MAHRNPSNAPDASDPSAQQPWLYFGAGVALALGLHVLIGLGVLSTMAAIGFAVSQQWVPDDWANAAAAFGLVWLLAFSLLQLLYLGPAWAITHRWRPFMAHGVLVVMVLTFLLQGSCYALFGLSGGLH